MNLDMHPHNHFLANDAVFSLIADLSTDLFFMIFELIYVYLNFFANSKIQFLLIMTLQSFNLKPADRNAAA